MKRKIIIENLIILFVVLVIGYLSICIMLFLTPPFMIRDSFTFMDFLTLPFNL